jgi:glycosyltransferase involved in cell wall biosynthesis
MKIFFLFFSTLNPDTGVKKKVISQSKALEKLGCSVETCHYEFNKQTDTYTLKAGEVVIETTKNNLPGKLKRRYSYKKLTHHILTQGIEALYIRYTQSADPFFNHFLRKLKRNNIKILLEIPTYPYDEETNYCNFRTKLSIRIEKFFRKYLYNSVDRIITFSLEREIFRIPTIIISNGIDLEQTTLINNKSKPKESLVFTGVAEIKFWHGLDRIIESLKEYYKKNQQKRITLNIVGPGDTITLHKLKSLVKNYSLTDYVLFHDSKSGEALDDIYNDTDIGLGSLARHRSDVHTLRTLKNREYAAKGLPMIFSEDDPDFRDVNFVYRVKADESLINLEDVVAWHQTVKGCSEQIRTFSQQFSWDIQMKKVLNAI